MLFRDPKKLQIDVGGVPQSLGTRGDQGKRSETLRGGLETGQGGRDRLCAGALAASLDVESESGQVLGPELRPSMLKSQGALSVRSAICEE